MVENTHEESATGRLYLLMSALRDFGLQQPGNAMVEGFRAYFGTNPNDWERLLPLIAEAAGLPDAATREVESVRLPIPAGHFDAACSAARQVFTYSGQITNTASQEWPRIITERAVATLQYASEALWQASGDPIVSPDDLVAVRAAAQDLVDAIVGDPSLDDATRRLLLQHAHGLRDAVDHYRSFGFDGLEAWQASFLGTVVLRPEVQEVVATKPTIVERIDAVFRTIATVATAAHATYVMGGDPLTLTNLVMPIIEQRGIAAPSSTPKAIEAPKTTDEGSK